MRRYRYDDYDSIDEALARDEEPHAMLCSCDDCRERHALMLSNLPLSRRNAADIDAHRIGEGTFLEHFEHVTRDERNEVEG